MSFGPAQGGSSGAATSVSAAAFPLLAPDGTLGAPSYAFASEGTLGLYRIASGVLGLAGADAAGPAIDLRGPADCIFRINTAAGTTTNGTFLISPGSTSGGTGANLNLVSGATSLNSSAAGNLTLNVGAGRGSLGETGSIVFNVVDFGATASTGQGATQVGLIQGPTNATSGTRATFKFNTSYSDGATTSTTVAKQLSLEPTINYTAASKTGHYEAMSIAVTETSLPTGTNYLIRAAAGVAGTTDKFTVANTGATAIISTADDALDVSTTSSASGGRAAFFSAPASLSSGAKTQVNIVDSNTSLATGAGGGMSLLGLVQPSVYAPLVSVYASKTNATDNDRNAYFVVAPNNNVAGGVNNCVATLGVSDLVVKVNSGVALGWTSSATNVTTTALDTGLSRDSAGVIDFGTGAAGSVAGSWKATNGTLTGTLTFSGLPGSGTVVGQPTWNSNQNITLGTAAQPNVTSVGTLTSLTMGGAAQLSWATGGSPSATTPQLLGPTDAGLFISANSPGSGTGKALTLTAGAGVGVGGASPGGVASLTGGAGANGSLGGLASLSGGAPGSGSTDKGSGGVLVSTGLPTGAGTADYLVQSGFALGSGTTTQTAYDRQRITSNTKNSSAPGTSGTVINYCNISNAVSNSGVGCSVDFIIEVGDGANHWSTICGTVDVAASNQNGTVTAASSAFTVLGVVSDTTTFTALTTTTTATVSGTTVQLKVTPTWAAGTPTVVRVTYQVRANGQCTITPQ